MVEINHVVGRVWLASELPASIGAWLPLRFVPICKGNRIRQAAGRQAVRRCQQFTEDDEEFVGKVIRLVEDGSLPKATAKKIAAALKKPENLPPLKVLAVIRRDVKYEFFHASPAAHASQALAPREVILSSWLTDKHQI